MSHDLHIFLRSFHITSLHLKAWRQSKGQPLLLLSNDSLRLLSASPLLFRPPPPPMNTLVTCVFRVRWSDAVAGEGRRHGDVTVTGEEVAPAADAAAPGCGRGRLREVMTLIMTSFATETVLPFRPLVRSSLRRSYFQLEPRIIIMTLTASAEASPSCGRKPGIRTGTALLLSPEFRSRLLRRQFPGWHPRRHRSWWQVDEDGRIVITHIEENMLGRKVAWKANHVNWGEEESNQER